jgi:hypothetical protein
VAATVPNGFHLNEIIFNNEAQLLPPGHPLAQV